VASLVVTATEEGAGRSVFHLRGDLDYTTTGTLRTPAVQAFATKACTAFTLDLAELTFLDSSGLGLLVELSNAARNDEIPMALVNAPTAIRRVIEIAGLTSILGLTPPAPTT
jgi:anti-anti-sigma factor